MNQTLRLKPQKGDFLAIALVIVIALSTLAAFLPDLETAGSVQIYRDGKLAHKLSLQRDTAYTLSGAYANTITVQDGKVAITASDCPGGDCMHSGWIQSVGRSVVCLPNRVEVRIVGPSDVDFVVG